MAGKSNTQPVTKTVGTSKTVSGNQPHSSTNVPVYHACSTLVHCRTTNHIKLFK